MERFLTAVQERMFMKLIFDEICNTFNANWKDHVTETHVVEGGTLKECFRKAYPFQRSLRYCSGYRIQFRDPDIDKQYRQWLRTGVDIQLYYGGGTID